MDTVWRNVLGGDTRNTLLTPVLLKNNASAIKHRVFVTTAINELLESGCIVEQSNRPFCVNPLSVSVNKNGKERLILDLRHVNQFVEKRKIKFEGSKEALNYAKKGIIQLRNLILTNSFIAVVTNALCFIADALFFKKTGTTPVFLKNLCHKKNFITFFNNI
jgi:hypothetical protein